MSAIVIPRQSLRQPKSGALAPASRLADGLVVLQSDMQFARGGGAATGAPGPDITSHGKGWRGGAGKYFTSPSQYQPPQGGPFSVAMGFVVKTVPGSQVGLWSMAQFDTSGSPRILIVISSTQVRFYWWASYRITMSVSLAANTYYSVILSHDGETGTAYVNGLASDPVVIAMDAGYRADNWYYGNGFGGNLDATYLWQAQWSRALRVSEAVEISRNPWSLFRANPAEIDAFPSIVSAPAITSITAGLITSSGARITLGLTR